MKSASTTSCIRCTDNSIIIAVNNVAHLYNLIDPELQEANYIKPQ